ncbi:hypothetical protein ACIRL0_37535 [Streptomyces sp. NPDC102365]|uniref:hypothetical protein n=1 Tax=Streptomyces sp. NPDC102365 TaxID=3366162 RepID=UPI00381E255E
MPQLMRSYAYLRTSAVQDSPAGRSAAREISGCSTPVGDTANPCRRRPAAPGVLTGAYAAVWAVLGTTLPHLPRDPVVRGTGALLALGVDCASHSPVKGAIPEVTTAAARSGSSRLLKDARLLRDALS